MSAELRLAVDTNVLVYAEGHGDAHRCGAANSLMQRLLRRAPFVLPVQVCGELFTVLIRKAGRDATAGREAVERWCEIATVAPTDWAAMQGAFELVRAHGLSPWDAVVVAVAADQRCSVLLSEDLQHGFQWRGVCVVDPFVAPPHPRLAALLA